VSRKWLGVVGAGTGTLLAVGVLSGSAASLSLTSQNLTPYRTCTITATPATTTAVTDTTARQTTANGNFGAFNTLTVQSGSNPALNQRTYIRFDLIVCSPAIPSSAIVRLATLRLYMTVAPGACRILDIFRVTAAWGEMTLTWNNQPFGTTVNNPPTGSRSGTFSVGPAGCQNPAGGAYVIGGTVTADVASFVAGTVTNFGWMIRDDTEGSATNTTTFAAKELGTVAQEPQLVITYVTVP
jgi:hypothetical protein